MPRISVASWVPEGCCNRFYLIGCTPGCLLVAGRVPQGCLNRFCLTGCTPGCLLVAARVPKPPRVPSPAACPCASGFPVATRVPSLPKICCSMIPARGPQTTIFWQARHPGRLRHPGGDGKSWCTKASTWARHPGRLRHPGGDEQTPRGAPYEAKTIKASLRHPADDGKSWPAGALAYKTNKNPSSAGEFN